MALQNSAKRKGDEEKDCSRQVKCRRDSSSVGPSLDLLGTRSKSLWDTPREMQELKNEQSANYWLQPSLQRRDGSFAQNMDSSDVVPRSLGKPSRDACGQSETQSACGSMLSRVESDVEGSLTRLMSRRVSWSHRDASTRSAFREVHKRKSFSPRDAKVISHSLPPLPQLFHDRLFDKDVLRLKSKPFAGLSEIEAGASGGNVNPAQPIIQPLQESHGRYSGLSHLTGRRFHPHTDMKCFGTYITPQQSQFDGWRGVALNAKRSDEPIKYVEKTIIPLGRHFQHNYKNNINITNKVSPYLALPGLVMASPLPSPSLGMLSAPTENWCARCRTSFRMTSDLVYHMRTYHKRDNPSGLSSGGGDSFRRGDTPTTQERQTSGKACEEKLLRCQVCRETFRERHHLTRHMTSHIR